MQFQLDKQIQMLRVGNDVMHLFLKGGSILRIDLNHPENVHTIQLNCEAKNCWISGETVIYQTTRLEYFYLREKPVKIKLKGEVTHMSFDNGSALACTSSGRVYRIRHDRVDLVWSRKSKAPLVGVCPGVAVSGDGVVYKWADSFKSEPHSFKMEGTPIAVKSNNGTILIQLKDSLTWVSKDKVTKNDLRTCPVSAESAALTKYHILSVSGDELVVINQLNGEIVASVALPEYFTGVTSDDATQTYWLYSHSSVFEIVVENEASDVWKILTQQKKFNEALMVLQSPINRDAVLKAQAEFLLAEGSYKEAAAIFPQTSFPLESVALKFIELGQTESLRIYLEKKVGAVDAVQKTILGSWIVELYVEGAALEQSETDLKGLMNGETKPQLSDSAFHAFLESHISILDKTTVYQILLSHNKKEELLFFAKLIKDYEFVLKYYVNLQMWDEALTALASTTNLIYKYSTVLLINHPAKTVDTWIRLIDEIDVVQLVPALLTYDNCHQGPQSARFLSYAISRKKCPKIVHHTLLSILVSKKDEKPILKYLETENAVSTPFDFHFTIRLFLKHGKIQSAIFLYLSQEQYEKALNLSTEHNLWEMCVSIANKPSDLEERKKLWLKYAKFLVAQKSFSEKYILDLALSECEALTMKDMLPLFPDITVIDNFKEHIVGSLKRYSLELEEIKVSMDEAVRMAKQLDSEKEDFLKNHFQIIEPLESCCKCQRMLITRKFIIFPCNHAFHQDCMADLVIQSTDYKMKSAIHVLQKKILENSKTKIKGTKSDMESKYKGEIDHLLTEKCGFCSDLKISTIEEAFPSDDKWEL